MFNPAKLLFTTTIVFFLCAGNAEQSATPQIPLPPQSATEQPLENNQPAADSQKKWADAKDATKKALQQSKEAGESIWEAGKESTQEIWSDGKALGGEVWNNVKQKSTTILEKSETLLNQSNQKLEELLEEQPQQDPLPAPSNVI